MKQAYKGMTFTGTLFCDLLCAAQYEVKNGRHWMLAGGIDCIDFANAYGYNEEFHKDATSAESKAENDAFNEAIATLKWRGLITMEHYTRPAGRGWVSNRVRIVLHISRKSDLEIADKYIAAMKKAKGEM